MKQRKRDTASRVSSTRSIIAHAMRVRILKVPANLVPQVPITQDTANTARQKTIIQALPNLSSHDAAVQSLITAPPTNTTQEF